MLDPINEHIWTHRADFVMFGLHLGCRVTVAQLPGGGLWVHSPVELTDDLRRSVNDLGTVTDLVAPNLMHHLWLPQWASTWPDARVHGPRGLDKKRTDVVFQHWHEDGLPQHLEGVFDAVKLEGMPMFAETWFFHRPSRTLVTADLVLAIEASVPSWWTRTYLRLCGIGDKPLGCSAIHKLEAKDKAAVRRSVDTVLALPWTTLIVSHGQVIRRDDVRELVRDAYAWLPAAP